jgi:protoheme IX farnesyltransferase
MLPVVDPGGTTTGRQMVAYCLALVLVSLMPVGPVPSGVIYRGGAALLGVGFLLAALGFCREHSSATARRVLRASLIYLPLLLVLLLVEGVAR